MYVYNNCHLLFFLDDRLLSWLDWNPIQSNPILMMELFMPKTYTGWRNILRISSASSWLFFIQLFCKTQVLYTKIMLTLKLIQIQLSHSCARFEKYSQSIKRNNNIKLHPNLTVVVFCPMEKLVPDISEECNGFNTSGPTTK